MWLIADLKFLPFFLSAFALIHGRVAIGKVNAECSMLPIVQCLAPLQTSWADAGKPLFGHIEQLLRNGGYPNRGSGQDGTTQFDIPDIRVPALKTLRHPPNLEQACGSVSSSDDYERCIMKNVTCASPPVKNYYVTIVKDFISQVEQFCDADCDDYVTRSSAISTCTSDTMDSLPGNRITVTEQTWMLICSIYNKTMECYTKQAGTCEALITEVDHDRKLLTRTGLQRKCETIKTQPAISDGDVPQGRPGPGNGRVTRAPPTREPIDPEIGKMLAYCEGRMDLIYQAIQNGVYDVLVEEDRQCPEDMLRGLAMQGVTFPPSTTTSAPAEEVLVEDNTLVGGNGYFSVHEGGAGGGHKTTEPPVRITRPPKLPKRTTTTESMVIFPIDSENQSEEQTSEYSSSSSESVYESEQTMTEINGGNVQVDPIEINGTKPPMKPEETRPEESLVTDDLITKQTSEYSVSIVEKEECKDIFELWKKECIVSLMNGLENTTISASLDSKQKRKQICRPFKTYLECDELYTDPDCISFDNWKYKYFEGKNATRDKLEHVEQLCMPTSNDVDIQDCDESCYCNLGCKNKKEIDDVKPEWQASCPFLEKCANCHCAKGHNRRINNRCGVFDECEKDDKETVNIISDAIEEALEAQPEPDDKNAMDEQAEAMMATVSGVASGITSIVSSIFMFFQKMM